MNAYGGVPGYAMNHEHMYERIMNGGFATNTMTTT